jgi:phosphoenolpyruvate synthase/pyruvate phosphate dikinase
MLAVIPLSDSRARDSSIAGNKAATLARLLGRGYPVPAGVVLGAAPHPPESRDDLTALTHALDALELQPPWVVRSSSSVEDGARSAFPGIFHTQLGVRTTTELAVAVLSVRRSVDGSEAKRYAAARGLGEHDVLMAVLIQPQLHPRAAGVAFSRDPVTGADQVVVEANYGLGQTVVDGSVTPDRFAITRDLQIVSRTIGSKREELVFGPDGLERRPVAHSARARAALSDSDAVRVAQLAWTLESDLGPAQDMEWAFVQDSLSLLQTRPITTSAITTEGRT